MAILLSFLIENKLSIGSLNFEKNKLITSTSFPFFLDLFETLKKKDFINIDIKINKEFQNTYRKIIYDSIKEKNYQVYLNNFSDEVLYKLCNVLINFDCQNIRRFS